MKELVVSTRFKKDLKLARKRGLKMGKLEQILDLLVADEDLPAKHRPHKLSGNYDDLWECHIEPDWLLIYNTTEDTVELFRTGTHADLFC